MFFILWTNGSYFHSKFDFFNIFYSFYSVHKTKLYICFLRLNNQFIIVLNISNLSTNKMDVK